MEIAESYRADINEAEESIKKGLNFLNPCDQVRVLRVIRQNRDNILKAADARLSLDSLADIDYTLDRGWYDH